MSEHTPGPWLLENRGYKFIVSKPGDGYITRDVCRLDGSTMSAFAQEANARLIAAAPALLEALKMVRKTVEEVEQGVSGEANYTHSYKVWTEAVREAIAAAEGEKR